MNETKESGPRTAKISPPRLQHVLARTRLFVRLDAARTHRVLWITGPPGAGKTTLAGSYIQARKLRALWYQLDEGDADLASFFHYLGLSVKALAPRYRKPLPALTPEYLPGLLTFTRCFFETLSQRLGSPGLIVLDDYHEVPAGAPLFDYFALEIFERLAPSRQAALLCTAFLRCITQRQAERLTGDPGAGRMLADLERRNYFVMRRAGAEPSYEYHPLFRDFLLGRARIAFDGHLLVTLQRRAAELLAEAGQPEEAAFLYHAVSDWQALSSLLLGHAPALLSAGRHQTLMQSLCLLPQAVFTHAPWLRCWQGMARLPFAPVEARGYLEEAYLRLWIPSSSSGGTSISWIRGSPSLKG